MRYYIAGYFKNKQIACYARAHDLTVSDENLANTAAQLECMIEHIVQDIVDEPKMGTFLLSESVPYSEIVQLETGEDGSQILPIPEFFLKSLGLEDGDTMDISVNDDGNIIMRKKQ